MKPNKWIIGMLAALLQGCTYNVSQAHTEGTATDVVDTEQKADAKVDPAINVPVNAPNSGQAVTTSTNPLENKAN